MTRFFTGTGDDGFTGLLKEGRVPKYHPLPEALGSIDEASAALGVARSVCLTGQSKTLLLAVQRDLYRMMSEIAASPENAPRFREISPQRVSWLEEQIDALGEIVEMPQEFIVPGDTQAGAALDLARAVVRRAERQITQLLHSGDVENPDLLRYLNRLSSLCFALELLENKSQGVDIPTLAKE